MIEFTRWLAGKSQSLLLMGALPVTQTSYTWGLANSHQLPKTTSIINIPKAMHFVYKRVGCVHNAPLLVLFNNGCTEVLDND
jgi:hypothetical protein